MNRIILIVLLTLSCASPLLAQGKTEARGSQCTLAADRTPELRGLRVGIPQAAVLTRFPGTSVDKPDKLGVAQLRLTVIDMSGITRGLPTRDRAVQPDTALGGERAFVVDSAKFTALKGVRRIQFRFVDSRLAFLQVAYDDSIKWNTIDELVETVSKALNLPGDWSLPPDANGSDKARELRCEAFVITADLSSDPSDTRIGAQLSVEDLVASKLVEKRQNDLKDKAQAAEDAKRKVFKP